MSCSPRHTKSIDNALLPKGETENQCPAKGISTFLDAYFRYEMGYPFERTHGDLRLSKIRLAGEEMGTAAAQEKPFTWLEGI